MDEAFMPLHRLVESLAPTGADFVDEEMGVHTYVTAFEIESPVELDVVMDAEGVLRIGSTPPLYYVDTSIRPSFHRLRFTAQRREDPDG
jgi:hypothetical protein